MSYEVCLHKKVSVLSLGKTNTLWHVPDISGETALAPTNSSAFLCTVFEQVRLLKLWHSIFTPMVYTVRLRIIMLALKQSHYYLRASFPQLWILLFTICGTVHLGNCNHASKRHYLFQ